MKIFQVDAFTDRPFTGNPAGVCIMDRPQKDAWMLGVAREMNLSETAFLLKQEDGLSLRWFTPAAEVSLCGHATLASAYILWQQRMAPESETIRFTTRSGVLTAVRKKEWIELDFPALEVEPAREAGSLSEALKFRPVFAGRHMTPEGILYLLEFEREANIRAMSPDMKAICRTDALAVIVTSLANEAKFDFVSRCFAPVLGIDEDPVTGVAHCCLAPYWGRKLGRNDLTGFQASERTGIVGCSWRGDRVLLKGKAVTIFEGNLTL